MHNSETKIRVRYGDTDRMGYCYYGNYAAYFEVARTEFMRELGISYKDIEDSGILMPVINLYVEYKKPALYDEELTVRTYIKELPVTRITFFHEVYNEQNTFICKGETTLAFINTALNKPVKAPEELVRKLERILH